MIRIIDTPRGGMLAVGDRAELTAHGHLDHTIGDAELAVPWCPAGSAFTPIDRLGWRSRYSPLVGREDSQAELLAWAREDGGVRARVLVGESGAGKSRLAAEVASILQGEGWAAGVAGWNDRVVWRMGDNGTFVVVDEPPEPADDAWSAPSRLAGDRATPAKPVRLLLLRRDWSTRSALPGFSVQRLDPLSPRAAATLHERIVGSYRPDRVALPTRAFIQWCGQFASIPRCPLYTVATALVVCHPPWDGQYPKNGDAAIAGLINATWRSLNLEGERAGLAADVVPLLVALTDACDGLDEEDLRRLAAATSLTVGEPEEFVGRVSRLPMWRDSRLQTCVDGPVRGAFLCQAFVDAHWKRLGARIAAARPVTSLTQLTRLDRDLSDAGADARLCRFLADTLPVRDLDLDLRDANRPVRAGSLLGRLALHAAERDAPALPVAASGGATDDDHAEALLRLAKHLMREDGPAVAIAPAREAVMLYRRLLARGADYGADLDDAMALLSEWQDWTRAT
jgi:hypothetical protein